MSKIHKINEMAFETVDYDKAGLEQVLRFMLTGCFTLEFYQKFIDAMPIIMGGK